MLSLIPRLPIGHIRARSLAKARTAPAASTGPSWLGAVGEWSTVGGSSLSSSGVMHTNGNKVIEAWGGAVVNTTGVYDGATWTPGTFLILWGGGHGDYSGNEVYALGPLENDTPTWRRLRDATSPAPTNTGQDGSGNPVSRHSYSSIVYDSSANELLSIGGIARYNDAGGVSEVHVFNFDQASPNTNQPWSARTSCPDAPSDVAAYEPSSGLIWYHPDSQNRVSYYSISGNSHTSDQFKSPGWTSAGATSAIDTVRGLWAIASKAGVLNFYRTNNGTGNDYYTPSQTGSGPAAYQGFVYDAVSDVFRAWNNGGKTIYTLTPPGTNPYSGGNAWTWSSSTPSGGSTPSAASANGTYSRFAWVNNGSSLKGCILLNAAAESAYFYRVA